MIITRLEENGTPPDQDCPECGSERSVVLGDSGLWKCESCSTIFDWQQIEEVQTKDGQTFNFPVKAKAQGDSLYIESFVGFGRMPDSCRELGDSYWLRLTEKQLLSWVEILSASLQVVYEERKEAEEAGSKIPPLSSLKLTPYYVLSDVIDASEDEDGTFETLGDGEDHLFWNKLTWSDLHWLIIWAIGRLLDKGLVKRSKEIAERVSARSTGFDYTLLKEPISVSHPPCTFNNDF